MFTKAMDQAFLDRYIRDALVWACPSRGFLSNSEMRRIVYYNSEKVAEISPLVFGLVSLIKARRSLPGLMPYVFIGFSVPDMPYPNIKDG